MNIFLSYPSKERTLADEIQLALTGAGHTVFFDRESLPAGDDYHQRIRSAVNGADLFVFLITPDSVAQGSYAITEMGYARTKWANPAGRVLPVVARPTPMADIPPYLKSVTLLQTSGNLVAEVVAAAERLRAAAPPSMPSSTKQLPVGAAAGIGSSTKLALLGGGILLALAAGVFFWPDTPSDPGLAKLEIAVEQAKVACAADSDAQSSAKASAQFDLLLSQIKGEGGITAFRNKHNGAASALPAELQVSENAQIRECMKRYMPAILELIGVKVAPLAADAGLPRQLDLRFSYKPKQQTQASLDNELFYSLQMRACTISTYRLAPQPAGFYSYPMCQYPDEGEQVLGTLVREVNKSTQNDPPMPATFCLQRPKSLQPSDDKFVHLDCPESASCQVHFPSPKWLEPCAAEVKTTSRAFSFIAEAQAATVERHWSVPSVPTLASHKDQLEGVGYTIFSVETDAFRDPAVTGIEVDVRVNGKAILENGLAPEQRPVANNAAAPFKYEFALESLDFEGTLAGCEAIQLSLRPRLSKGKAEALRATLPYVALRDQPAQTAGVGKTQLRWSAHYVIPAHEWSHEAFITSITYAAADGDAGLARARQRAQDLKQAFDRLRLEYQGQPLVAVIRPPLTTQSYGLTTGVVQPSGQVRFTFSYEVANAIGDSLLAARAAGGAAPAIIASRKFIYNPTGNPQRRETPTPPGVCGHVPTS